MNRRRVAIPSRFGRRTGKDAMRIAPFLALALLCCGAVGAQDQRLAPTSPSDLGQENMSLVAASAAEIKAVLEKDAGLMVELKRWVAKDATDHGQIVSEADLSNNAIYDRLEGDTRFRSVATMLLQRYGYLVPKVNPDSEVGREQEMLVQERVKWLAQDQEERRAAAHQRSAGNSQNAASPASGGPLEHTQLVQSGGGRSSSAYSQVSLGTAYGSGESSNTLGANPLGPAPQAGVNNTGDELGSFMTASNSQDLNAAGNSSTNGMSLAGAGGLAADTSSMGGGGPDSSLVASASPMPPLNPPSPSQMLPHPVEMSRAPNPYSDIPSLYDMYLQATPHPSAPTRFGMDVFANGTRDSQLIPMDLPAGPDYVVGPGDGLAINLWGGISQRLYRTVDREGRVDLPEVGPLLVSGKSLAEVQQSFQQVLRTQFRDVSADISLARLRTIRIYVVGDVVNPGAYDISSLSTPLNALFVAGGPTARGSLRIVKHYRGSQLVQDVDLYDLLLHGVKSDIQRLDNGDTVLVPPIGPQVTVEGMVRRPAIYELKNEKYLASLLDLAGGLLPTAALQHIEVQRTVAHEKRTMVSLDLPDGEAASEVTQKLASFEIHDGDQIRLFPIAPYNQNAVYLEGHVLRPGRYSYQAGMRVTDLISSYKDLLPEPAGSYAEIIHLSPPDYRPTVESFKLTGALANPGAAPKLEPMDTVRVFSRYDFEDLPAVMVLGAVREPGTYRSTGQLHLREAIQLAGGLRSDASLADAQVFTYLPNSQVKVTSIDMQQALAGNPLDNIVLQPRDRLLVHRNPAAADPPSVYLKGEVLKPGRYPLAADMRVADLIRLGGGFTRGADMGFADLTEYLVKNSSQGAGEHHEVKITAVLAADPDANLPLRDGDTLTIRQVAGWGDVGAQVSVRGEVRHVGTYGIRPGERLSSVLMRAGGFLPTAYPQGLVFEREDVRKFQEKNKQDLIQRLQQEGVSFKTSIQQSAQDQASLQQSEVQQTQRAIAALQQAPTTGRMVVRLRGRLAEFRNSPDDIELRAGDTIYIPKRPEFILVTGQVYNSNAVTYRPHRDAAWYLRQAGGPTEQGNRKAIFIIRADGSVVSGQGEWWSGGTLSIELLPGDTVVVPEKPVGGSATWKNLLGIAQIAQAASITALVLP